MAGRGARAPSLGSRSSERCCKFNNLRASVRGGARAGERGRVYDVDGLVRGQHDESTPAVAEARHRDGVREDKLVALLHRVEVVERELAALVLDAQERERVGDGRVVAEDAPLLFARRERVDEHAVEVVYHEHAVARGEDLRETERAL